MQSITANTFFIDIDGTITADRDEPQISSRHLLGNVLFERLRTVMVDQGWETEKAGKAIADFAEALVFWDYPDFVAAFNLPPEPVWAAFREWHNQKLQLFPDAIALIRHLQKSGRRLAIVSNNPLTGCLFKLERAGLATLFGAPGFGRIFCANIQRGQKGNVEWWRRVAAHYGGPLEEVVLVGDSEKEDHLIPAQVGFRHFVLVDRTRTTPPEYSDGVWRVRALDEVIPLLCPVS